MASSSSYSLAPLPPYSELLPLIDLRFLTQSELHSLSVSSSFSPAPPPQDNVVPKIDRSVFNESAGSRKQTYSRLRLAPRKPELSTSSSTTNPIHHLKSSSSSVFVNDLDHAENCRIVNLFRGLFGDNGNGSDKGIAVELFDNNELVPVHIEYLDTLTNSSLPLYSFNNNNNGSGSDNLGVDVGSLSALHNVSVNVAPVPDLMHDSVANHSASGFKRKRGRPRKDENNIVVDNDIIRDIIVSYEQEEEEEFREIKENASDNERLNRDGVEVDILGLGSMEDLYGQELRRRTVGLDKEEELLGFLSGLAGRWGSRRKKRKIVDANIFGNALPQGWKLLLSIKKKDGHAWLICRRYISPSGRHFISCKEVSSYLQSIYDLENVSNQSRQIVESDISSQQLPPPAYVGDNSADSCRREDLGHGFTTHLVSPSMGHKKQAASTSKSSMIMKSGDIFNCHICSTSFSEGNDLLHHLLFSHKSIGKRRKIGANVGDGVIIRDGKFECQFCHKIFDERHRYSGHVGNHVKNYVKNIAAAPLLSTPNGMESAHVAEDPLVASMMDITIANDVNFIESSYDGGTEICLSSDRPRDKLQVRARSTLDSSTDRFYNDLSEHMQEVEWDRKDSLGDDISIDKLDEEYQMTNAEVENVNETSGRNEVKLSVDDDAALSKDDNDRTCVNLDETGIMRSCDDDKSEPEFSESCLPSFSGEEKDGSNNNTTKVSASSLEEAQEDRVDGSDAPSFLKESATEGKVDMPFSEREASNRPAFDSPTSDSCSSGKDLLTKSNQRVSSSSQLKSDVPDNECTTSTVETVGHQECIQPTLFCDNQSFMLNNNLDELSNRIFGTKFNETGDSDEKDPQVGTDSYHFNIRDNMRVQLEGNSGYSPIPFVNQQMSFVSDSIDGVGTTTSATYGGDTASGNSLASLPGSEQLRTVLETRSRDSCSEMERETSGFRNSRDTELMTSFGSIQTGLEEGRMSTLQQEKNSEGMSLASPHQVPGVRNSMDASGSLMEETRPEKAYFSGLVDTSGDHQNDERNGRMVASSGNNHSRLNFNRDFEDHSLVFSGNEQAEGSQNNATGPYSASLAESKHGSAYASGMLTPYGQELMFGLENNLNREVPADSMRGGRSSQPVESSVDHDLMIGFGNNLTPRDQDVLSGNMWRTEENILQSGLGDASLPVVQSSNYFPTFGMIRNKGGNELFGVSDRFDNLVDFEELKSGSIQQREYNFLASQTDSHPEKSHAPSYGTETEQGFNSSLWLGNDSLFPKASTVSQSTATCGWCQNEYYDEAFNAATQSVSNSFGQICPSCKSKISGQLNVL